MILDSTFSRTVWRLYGGAKGLAMWYYQDYAAQLNGFRVWWSTEAYNNGPPGPREGV